MDIIIIIFSLISIVGTLLPKSDSKNWFIRGQSNFRAIYLFFNILMLVLVLSLLPFSIIKIGLCIFLSVAIFLCLKSILPYTRLYPKTINDAQNENGTLLKIFIHNVYQFNNKFDIELMTIKEENPDIILLIEVDTSWENAMSELRKEYPYEVKEIRKDTYGIMMLSKIELDDKQINHLVYEHIPSTEGLLSLGGKSIRILGIHPEPPIPGEVLSSIPKDKEITNAAKYINNLPKDEIKILVGDFNDVAWSKVSKKFKKMTGLKDVRIGRGFFSTFPAYSPFQIPLDHVFCSPELKIVEFKTLDPKGSDHNPVSVTFKVSNTPSSKST